MTALQYIQWFINYNYYVNHTGNSQVCFLNNFSMWYSQRWGEEEKMQLFPLDLKKA